MKRLSSPLTAFCSSVTTRSITRVAAPEVAFSSLQLHSIASAPFDDANVVFEPVLPSTTTLVGMAVTVVLCVVVAWVWQTQVVPTSRTKLAISKSRGAVKEYLDELREAGSPVGDIVGSEAGDDGIALESLGLLQAKADMDSTALVTTSRAFERWLFSDWLQDNKSARRTGRQKEPALPILKNAKWNSGDNPVLVATLLITVGVLFSAVTERVAMINF